MSERAWMHGSDADVERHLQGVLERAGGAEPHQVLGLGPRPTPDQVRAAFLAATKQYHPARFARRSARSVQLANEAFLCVKEAYEALTSGSTRKSRVAAASSPPPEPSRVTERIATADVADPRTTARMATANDLNAEEEKTTTARLRASGILNPKFREASALCDRGQYSEARTLLLELTRDQPQNSQYRAHLHFATSGQYLAAGRASLAISELKRAVAADPGFEAARRALAQIVAGRLKSS